MVTPAEQAAMDRVLAGLRDLTLLLEQVEVDAADLTIALSNHFDALARADAREIATHPDLAELNDPTVA